MKAAIIGAPLDLGAGRRGVDMGPSAIRNAGLQEWLEALGVACVDHGNVATAVAEATAEHDPRARFLPAIRATCERIAGLVREALDEDRVPVVLGGDHLIALGTLGGLGARRGPGAVLWFDAHGDQHAVRASEAFARELGYAVRYEHDEMLFEAINGLAAIAAAQGEDELAARLSGAGEVAGPGLEHSPAVARQLDGRCFRSGAPVSGSGPGRARTPRARR